MLTTVPQTAAQTSTDTGPDADPGSHEVNTVQRLRDIAAETQSVPEAFKNMAARLRRGGPAVVMPRGIRIKRTRHVNRDPDVRSARAALGAQLALLYEDSEKVREHLEGRIHRGDVGADLARRIFMNPAAFGDWHGSRLGEGTVHPDERKMAVLLDRTAGALSRARSEAKSIHPWKMEKADAGGNGKKEISG